MQFAQLADYCGDQPLAREPIGIAGLLGTWANSNPDSSGIARLELSDSNGRLLVQAFGIGPDGLVDWPTTEASIFSDGPSSNNAAGLTCAFDFGFAETKMQGMIMKGLLVLSQFHTFKDQSGRNSYFLREYFALDHRRY
ncbi:MAG TPA: hypothetical protein VLL54_20630 [Pyrinomonadaceae bacterium]|nr:hypothetical protein [Pyrinomonadaceae bacterium]